MINTRVSSATLVRWKKLKGGRKIIRSARTIKCNGPICPGDDNKFSTGVRSKDAYLLFGGSVDKDAGTFFMDPDKSKVVELTHPYLKKGFKDIVGYTLSVNKTNIKSASINYESY